MDKVEKALGKLNEKERRLVRALLSKLAANETVGLDIKKLKARDDIFRLRKGDLRLIFRRHQGEIFLLAIERRSEKTYRDH